MQYSIEQSNNQINSSNEQLSNEQLDNSPSKLNIVNVFKLFHNKNFLDLIKDLKINVTIFEKDYHIIVVCDNSLGIIFRHECYSFVKLIEYNNSIHDVPFIMNNKKYVYVQYGISFKNSGLTENYYDKANVFENHVSLHDIIYSLIHLITSVKIYN
jgi:hypothetical protein